MTKLDPRYDEPTKLISIRVPTTIEEGLRLLCRRQVRTRSDIVRTSILAALRAEGIVASEAEIAS